MSVLRGIRFLENDPQLAAVGKLHAFAEPAGAAKSIQHSGNGARILPKLTGFPFEAVYFFNDLDGKQNVIVFETEQRVGIVQENVGIKNIIFFHELMN